MIIWFFSFNLLIWCITLIDLCILKNPCISQINPTWSWCMILLMCCWILFASILLRLFASMFISDIGLWFSFLFIFSLFFFKQKTAYEIVVSDWSSDVCSSDLQFVNMVYHIVWFAYIEESLDPWDKSHLIVVYDPFNVLLDSVC